MKGQPEPVPAAPPPYPGEGPPPPGFSPGPTVMAPPVAVVRVTTQLGPHPTQVQCTRCNANVLTSTKTTPGLLTYLIAGGLCIFGCVFGCCLIPFCVDGCQNVEHFCPNCNTFLGVYNRL